MPFTAIESDRLMLRQWKESDKKPFAKLNADPVVMEFFPNVRTEEECNGLVDILSALINKNGFGFWAVDRKDTGEFIGFVGVNPFELDLPFCPCVEVGWRLAQAHWGQGFATEAANKSLDYGFTQLGLTEIFSFTTLENHRSIRVMEKIGMENTQSNFLHPKVEPESGLQEHVLYQVTREYWQKCIASL